MGDSRHRYKSLESEGEAREDFYAGQAERYADEATRYTAPPRRKFKGIDDYHRRAENTAFRTGDNFHEASKARNEHNANYMGHFKNRWDFDRHEHAVETNEMKSEDWHAADNAHRNLRAVRRTPVSFFGGFLTLNSPTLLVGGRSSSERRGPCSTRRSLRSRDARTALLA